MEPAASARSAPPPVYRGGRAETSPPLKCAWVTLIMIGKSYAPGALVLAASLRDVRTRHATVCMVTDDVPAETAKQLSLVFDRVVRVPYIEHPTSRSKSARQVELYKGWIDKSFTKWNCLELTEYDRVIFIDADMVAVSNIDDLFELAPPAATFANAYAVPWHRSGGGIPNPYAELLDCPGDSEGICDLPHGVKVPARLITAAIGAGFVGGASLMLLRPAKETFAALVKFITQAPVFGVGLTNISGSDEVSIAAFYAGRGVDWTNIHQRYQAILWKKQWVSRDIRGVHFIGRKPWDQDPEEWPDLADWWRVADRLVAKHPDLREVFRPTVTSVTPLDADMAQYRLTMDIRALLVAATRDSGEGGRRRLSRPIGAIRAEVDNIVERWLMTMVNTPNQGSRATAPWATVYRHSSPDEALNNKLAGELFEKRLVPSATVAGDHIRSILEIVSRRLSHLPRPSGAVPAVDAGGGSGPARLSYGSHFQADITPRIRRLIELGGVDRALAVVLRYAVVVSAGQQWGLPQKHVDHLFREFGVRGEAFASPLNSRLLGKEGASFCSIFPDTDAFYGSIGDFFALSDEGIAAVGNWVVNPPFVEKLLNRAAAVVTNALAGAAAAKRDQTFFFIMPAWTDCEAYRTLHDCPYNVAETKLVPGEYVYEDPSGTRINTKAASIYFALSTGPVKLMNRLSTALRTGMD